MARGGLNVLEVPTAMKLSHSVRSILAVLFVALSVRVPAAHAADKYEINAILSLTGDRAFIGTSQLQALNVLADHVNKTGGIRGRTLAFVAADDQSSPQVGVQLANGLISKRVPIIMGPSSPGGCAAIMPVVAQSGPLLYCLANQGDPPVGGYAFLTLYSADAQMGVPVRYFRERGWNRIAYIVSSVADGQDAERALLKAVALPDNKSLQIVAHEYFAPNDLSVSAQMARIKAAKPDVLIAWAAGTTVGTLLHGEKDAGLDLPTLTSPGNLTPAFFKQFSPLLPAELYFGAAPYYGADTLSDKATKTALGVLETTLATVGGKPDQLAISAWDPGSLLVEALRKLGPDASATDLRNYLINLKGWIGVNGPYDFRAIPQRGIGENNVIVVKYEVRKSTFSGVSKFGGAPLKDK